MADTELQQLVVWVGTTEKIEQARAQGLITENDFAITTDAPEFQTKLTSANAGTGISITEVGGVVKISNTQTSAEWGNIQGSIQTQMDLWNYLSQIGVLSSLSTTVKTDLVSAINEVYGVVNTALQPSDIVNSTDSTATNKALSANMGKSLQDQIDNLSARGRFLALWNCATGLAQSNPPENTYIYKSGDYFIVGTVASGSGTNYRPDGSEYVIGVASTVVETAEVSIDDVYYYDGQNWRLQVNTQKTLSFGNIAGDPYDNTALAGALNAKQDELVQGTGIAIDTDTNTISNSGVRGVSTGTTNGTISVNTNGTSAEVPVAGLGSAAYTPSTNYATSAQGSKADTALQDVQVNGTSVVSGTTANIPIASNGGTWGVVKVNSNKGITESSGQIEIIKANNTELSVKTNNYRPVVPSNLDNAVMEGLGNNSLTWTDAYKTSARNTIGAGAKTIIREWVG